MRGDSRNVTAGIRRFLPRLFRSVALERSILRKNIPDSEEKMKRFEYILLVFLTIFFIDSGITRAYEPSIQWQKTFGGSGDDEGLSVQQTTDGGFIITGYNDPFETGDEHLYLVKTDPNGDSEWDNNFYYYFDQGRGNCVRQTTDGGYIIAGNDLAYAILLKTDPNGNYQWSSYFVGGFLDDISEGYSVEQTTDGGYIITGYTGQFGPYGGSANVFLAKTDPNGDREWDKTFGSSSSAGYSVEQTTDGGYIVAGEDGGMLFLVKTEPNGNSEWDKGFGCSSNAEGDSVQQTTDGGYIAVGHFYDFFGSQHEDAYLIKTDPNGDSEWEKTLGGTGYEEGYSVQQTTDGGYIVAGSHLAAPPSNPIHYDVYLVKTDADGNSQWEMTIGGSSDDIAYSIQQTTDGGYIIAGETESYGAGGSDVYLIKLSPEVCNYVLSGDYNDDCEVNFYDFAIMAMSWLIESDFSDLSEITTSWLINCNADPTNPACIPK